MRKRRVFLFFVCFLLGAFLALTFTTRGTEARRIEDQASDRGDAPSTIQRIADASLEPTDVVKIQLESLQQSLAEPTALSRCYALASPKNLAAIGSLARFASLLRDTQYSKLLGHTDHLIGRPLVAGDVATIMVTITDADRQIHGFRFGLSRQSEFPYQDCWMTDSVLPVDRPLTGSQRPEPERE